MQWKELCSFYPSYVSLIFSVIERKWKRNCCHVELFTKDMRILYFYGVWIILRLVLLQFCCIFHTLFALNMVLKKQQQYAALGSLDPEPHFLNSLCSWLSRTCSPFPIILQQTEMDLFLILRSRLNFFLSFFSNTLHEVCAGTKRMIKGRGSIFHFPFLPSVSLNLKIVLDSGTIAWTECKAVGGNTRQMSEIACCAQ